ncbi:hypothetical protein JTE90_010472 [Oedothorax gibbosus]|uniref:DDE-1 domain-containing protein n=1 Tax=Oedothorax gibbosus TaxID=931172 RepID=A0AAV6W5Y1_9ARAC|nr:hypothetical protein JTE90_010472 [Oedothorax gibbosus]
MQSIECFDKQVEFSVNLLEAMCYLKKAWDTVSSAAIRNSFKRGGFKHPSFLDTFEEVPKTSNDLLIGAAESRGILSASMFVEYVSMDDGILTAEIPKYEDIINEVSEKQDIAISNQFDSDDDADTELPSIINFNEAAAALKTVQSFLMQQDYASCALTNLDKVDTFIKECFIDDSIKKSGTGSITMENAPLTRDK